jgi:hypothetical protein
VSFSTLFLSYAFYYHFHFTEIKNNFALTSWPTIEISQSSWWEKDEAIPASRVSLFGFPSQNINIQWAGDLEQIKDTLMKDGWSRPPLRDWISTLHRVTGIESAAYLPLVSPQYLDKKPVLILAKRTNGARKLLVIRLWDSNRTINKTSLWVGTLGVVHRSYSWLFRGNRVEIELDPALLFGPKSDTHLWQWKILSIGSSPNNKKKVEHKVLLIREKK